MKVRAESFPRRVLTRENSMTQVIARGVDDAGAAVVTNVPGFGGSQVLAEYQEIARSVHPMLQKECVVGSCVIP